MLTGSALRDSTVPSFIMARQNLLLLFYILQNSRVSYVADRCLVILYDITKDNKIYASLRTVNYGQDCRDPRDFDCTRSLSFGKQIVKNARKKQTKRLVKTNGNTTKFKTASKHKETCRLGMHLQNVDTGE